LTTAVVTETHVNFQLWDKVCDLVKPVFSLLVCFTIRTHQVVSRRLHANMCILSGPIRLFFTFVRWTISIFDGASSVWYYNLGN